MTAYRVGRVGTILAMALLATASSVSITAAQSQAEQAEFRFDIPAKPVTEAVNDIGRITGLSVAFRENRAIDVAARPVRGSMTADAALSTLLAGTGLSYRFSNATTVQIFDPSAAAANGPALAEDGSIILDAVTLQGQSASGPVDGYVATSALTAMKGDIPLIETPQSVSVVTADRIRDQGAQSLNEALRYTAGVRTEASGAQSLDNPLYLRGFLQSSLDTYQDGLRAASPGYFGFFSPETYGLERVEVLKGPSSVLYGQQTPGGLINMVSKRPTENPVNEVEATVGSFDHYQAAFDLGGTNEDKTLMYRLVGLGRDAETQVDFVDNDRLYIAPSLTYAPDADTKLTLLGSYQRNRGDFYAQVPASAVLLPNSNGHIPFSRFLGEPDWEGETSERLALGYEFEHRLNESVKFEQNFRYTHLTNHRQYLQASGALVNETTLNRRYTLRDITGDSATVDNRLLFDFDTGPVQHKTTLGLDYLWGQSTWLEQIGNGGTINIFDPVYGAIPNTDLFLSRALTETTAQQAGLYLQDQMRLDNWILTLGGRQDWAWRETDNLLTDTTTEQKDDAFTGRAGLAYLFDSGFAPYVSYSESFTPLIGTDRLGNPYVPETGQQAEIGVKYQPLGTNSFITLSAFDLRRQNVQTADPNAVSWTDYVQTGEIRVRGLELEGVASLDNGLSLTAAYTYTDAEITETNTAGQLGNTPYRIPEHAASLWLNYEFQNEALAGLTIGSGVRYTGETWGDDANSFRVPDFTLVDAAISYDFGKTMPEYEGLRASLNVSNLFDTYYVPACFTTNACNYGATHSVTGKLAYRW